MTPSSGIICESSIPVIDLHTDLPVLLWTSNIFHPVDFALVIIIIPHLVFVKSIGRKLIHTIKSGALSRVNNNTRAHISWIPCRGTRR